MAEDEPRERQICEGFKYNHNEFLLKNVTFHQQYSHVYNARLEKVQRVCEEEGHRLWPGIPFSRIVNAIETKCYVVGVLYKNMRMKPNFLEQYMQEMGEKDNTDEAEDKNCFKASEDDTLDIEDTSGRMNLRGKIPVGRLSTGMVVAAMGVPENGTLMVEEWMFAPMNPNSPLPKPTSHTPLYVAFVSGLGLGTPGPEQDIQLDAASAFLRGNMGCLDIVQNITRLVVAGGLMKQTPDLMVKDKIKLEMVDYMTMQSSELVPPMRRLDEWVAQIAETLPVDIMPGAKDPTNPFIPHQPVHPCLLPSSYRLTTTANVPSPYRFFIRDTIDVFVSSGEPLADLQRATTLSSLEDALTMLLVCGHLAPTAPDTLYCYPYTGVDPLQPKNPPHVLVMGNAGDFATILYKNKSRDGTASSITRLVSLPEFSKRPGITLLDFNSPELETLFIPIDIDVPLQEETPEVKDS